MDYLRPWKACLKKKKKVTEEGGSHDRAAHEVVKGRVLCPVGTMRIILNLESETTNLGAPVENAMAQRRKRCEIEVALKRGGATNVFIRLMSDWSFLIAELECCRQRVKLSQNYL